jgi:hypothetical protein
MYVVCVCVCVMCVCVCMCRGQQRDGRCVRQGNLGSAVGSEVVDDPIGVFQEFEVEVLWSSNLRHVGTRQKR